MSCEWRWLSGPGVGDEPALNMAIDQAIFEAHAEGIAPPTIRVYEWEAPVVTIGRLQSAEAARAAFPGLTCIRRPTGGRAVLHGDDLTISVVVREDLIRSCLAKRGILASYHLLLEAVVKTVAEYGVCLDQGSDRRREARSEDCFERVASCDLVERATGQKALGSAQLRRGGAILQQMSLRPLQKVQILGSEFQSCLRHNFKDVLGIDRWLENGLTPREQIRARAIVREEMVAEP